MPRLLVLLALVVGMPRSGSAAAPGIPLTGRNEPALAALDAVMVSFMKENSIPGAAVAITRQGRLVYAKGFGWADAARKRPVTPTARFRIASLSKAITAAAILKLAESGAISIETPAFPYLGLTPFLPPGAAVDPRLERITVWHLLHHSGGFDRLQSLDPALANLAIARELKVAPPAHPTDIIRYMMGRPLQFDPGTDDAYSNFGYLVLGRIIEKASGTSYEDYVRTAILGPLGISGMRLGRTFPEACAAGEVAYRSARHPGLGPSAFGDGPRPYPYGVWCLESMDAFAGWIASPIDLVKFANAVDPSRPSPLLDRSSLERMFARPETTGYYPDGTPKELYMACGWYVRTRPDGRRVAYHRGLLDGTSTLLVLGGDGMDWAVFFNSDTGPRGQELAALMDPLIDRALGSITHWPTYDLYGEWARRPADP